MALDSYPRLREYIDGLPDGWESYPDSKVRAEVFATHVQRLAKHMKGASLPEPLAALVRGQHGVWIPDVVGTSLPLILRDAVLPDDEALMKFTYDAAMQLFANPIYRVLMRVLSPMLILSGTARRWGTFRTGSQLESQAVREAAGRKHVALVLTHPSKIYPRLMLDTFAAAFRASIEMSGAKDSKSSLVESGETRSVFDLSWRAG